MADPGEVTGFEIIEEAFSSLSAKRHFVQGALVCSGVIGVVLLLHYFTRINTVLLFWAAFVFTRPFGATFGNFLTKEHAKGGLELGTLETSLVATGLLVAVVLLSSRIRKARLRQRTPPRPYARGPDFPSKLDNHSRA